MLSNYKNIISGLAGSVALTLVHQWAKRLTPDAPQVDAIGEEALSKIIQYTGNTPPEGRNLFLTTLAGDLAGNAMYYSLIGRGSRDGLVARGVGYGLAAGIGALTVTRPLGLDDEPVNNTPATQAMTVAWYLIGGLVTAFTLKCFSK